MFLLILGYSAQLCYSTALVTCVYNLTYVSFNWPFLDKRHLQLQLLTRWDPSDANGLMILHEQRILPDPLYSFLVEDPPEASGEGLGVYPSPR